MPANNLCTDCHNVAKGPRKDQLSCMVYPSAPKQIENVIQICPHYTDKLGPILTIYDWQEKRMPRHHGTLGRKLS